MIIHSCLDGFAYSGQVADKAYYPHKRKPGNHVSTLFPGSLNGEPNSITKEPIYVGCNFGFVVYL